MRCSHGVPYEAKCTKCFAEAMARETLRRLVAPAQLSAVNERDWYRSPFSNGADRIQLFAPRYAQRAPASCSQVEQTTVHTTDDAQGRSKNRVDAEAEETT
jgi:hypothetical protein